MRFTDAEKRQMLEEVMLQHKSHSLVAREHGMHKNSLMKLLERARVHGIDSVLHSSNKGSHAESFKYEVVQYIENGGTLSGAATQYNLNYSVVQRWYTKYSTGGTELLFRDARGRKKMPKETDIAEPSSLPADNGTEELRAQNEALLKRNKELEKKLRRAEMENEFLKKLDALVRERIERERKR